MRSDEELVSLLRSLVLQPVETPWLEFKRDNSDPDMIGTRLSAIANSARMVGRQSGFLVWGVEDGDHAIVGTTFVPGTAKKGNEGLLNWLTRTVTPSTHFEFHEFRCDGQPMVILEVQAASHQPVAFGGHPYIRVGEHTKDLKSVPAFEKRLWESLLRTTFESDPALEGVTAERVLEMLDHQEYCSLMELDGQQSEASLLRLLESEGLILLRDSGLWTITNLGALLFARDLRQFPRLARKAPRFIYYSGNARTTDAHEVMFTSGYAVSFVPLMDEVARRTPVSEVMGRALRKDVPLYPPLAAREIIANALIHQDLSLTGTGPMIELFSDRLEVTNPGSPLVDPERFVDAVPKSRNEALAALMRRIGVCEERGSGWDKVAGQVELFQLPAPGLEASETALRVTLFAPRSLAEMTRDERNRATYLHSCLRYVTRQQTTNTSIRDRFKIDKHNSATASRILKEAVESGALKLAPDSASKRLANYVPYWA